MRSPESHDPPGGAATVLDNPADAFVERPGDGPLVVSMPHSGTGLPGGVLSRLRPDARLLPDTDWGIPELYDFLDGSWAPRGIPTVLHSRVSRYHIDLNRDPSGASLYPGRPGTDLVPTTRFDGEPIWLDGRAPGRSDILARRRDWFEPWHAALRHAVEAARERHGFAVLWDAHSIRSRVPRLFEGRLPDLNLGTDRGASCHPSVERAAAKVMRSRDDLTSVVNGRFTGGWITRHHGRPEQHVHALQMEISLAAYMDECPPWTIDETRAIRLRDTLRRAMTAAVDAAADVHEAVGTGGGSR